MKAKEVQIGQVYLAKVSGKHSYVKILSESSRDVYGYANGRYGVTGSRIAWRAVNLHTGRDVFIKSATRLRALPSQPDTAAGGFWVPARRASFRY